jgi:UDP-hydrolysing UDP-N-acetyl-D-glucosamine 2-epimerase
VVVTARPSWAKLQTLCEALSARPDVELQIVACASALLERYGRVVDVIKAQGFSIAAECWSVYEGENLLTSAKETGALLGDLAGVLRSLDAGVVVACADRHEVLAVAQAAAYLHLPLAHLQGGERTGSIDDRVRDSVSALATYHFTCTDLAKYRVYGLTGAADRIWNTGCGSIDLAKRALSAPPVTAEELGGAGADIDLTQPFGVLLQHPVTNEAVFARQQMWETIDGWPRDLQLLAWWPGQDAGADRISKALREEALHRPIHTVRNLPPNRFLKLLTQASVLVGNSSAGIREASWLGVPVVNIGMRQWARERGPNVIDVPHDALKIRQAIDQQIAHGRYPSSALYGSGNAGARIAEVLTRVCDRADTRQVG